METIVKTTENKSQVIGQEIMKYFEKTSQHLFINKDTDYFYKVLTVKIGGVPHAIKLTFNGEKCNVSIYDLTKLSQMVKHLVDKGMYTSAAKVAVHEWKSYMFPGYERTKISIPNFKLMKSKMSDVSKYVQENYTKETETKVKAEIGEILKDIKPKA